MLFSRPKKAVGIDIGTHSVKTVVMSKSGGRLKIEAAGFAAIDRNRLNADPLAAQVEALSQALADMPLLKSIIVGALPGQSVVIRYPRLPQSAQDRLAQAVETEASQNIPYDLAEVFLDWSLLRTETDGDETTLKVLIVAAKHEVIDGRVQIAQECGVQYHVLGVDSLALSDAAESCDLLNESDTVALINLGAASTSIHFTKEGISNFIRDVSWGAREMIQAIAKAARCEYPAAEEMLLSSGRPQIPDAKPEEAPPPATSADSGSGGLGDLGGSFLDPLDEELGGLGGMSNAPKSMSGSPAKAAAPKIDINELLMSPMNRLVSEIRRSFDFYEQQLYEQPVNRIILSGGIAQLPQLRDTLIEELGIENVEVANPATGPILLGDEGALAPFLAHPPQYMVAVGLAARGAALL